ncbi:tryptophan synthase subunit alpha [Brevibacillus humidisoli]|uniref:tryptophan synthase subunit alpha n=1 Tax=Brevibacillus humidisoli TaxID=2895522 RepID=UPI001E42F988|nr:tryptophan synthase subunit alpha [Brevibacillus humidisoli]UFJ42770.1 tryptophan synthase subunit alpha [Brevibacillus humidisoli]
MIGVENRIDRLFAKQRQKHFIPFITVGDPSLDVSFRLVQALVEAGASLIELGVPYSDPLADGPTIQRASLRSLAAKTSIRDVVQFVGRLRQAGIEIPLVLFSYYNPVMQYGIEQFFADMREQGADGIVIPDLPVEENEPVVEAAKAHGLHVISLVAPTSEQRIAMIGQQASGFLYCVSSLGVTGARVSLREDLAQFLASVRANTTVPIAVGFGISTPEQVRQVADHADGVIVGSAIVQEIERNLSLLTDDKQQAEGIANIKTFVQSLVSALK